MTIYILAATMEEARDFAISRRMRKAKWIRGPEDWEGVTLSPQDYIIPLNSFFEQEDWNETYQRMPQTT